MILHDCTCYCRILPETTWNWGELTNIANYCHILTDIADTAWYCQTLTETARYYLKVSVKKNSVKDYLYLHIKDLLNMVNAMSETIYIKVTIRECLCMARLPRLDWSMGVFSVSIIGTTSIFQWLILLILEVLAAFAPVPFSGFIHFLCFASQSSDIVFVCIVLFG